MATTSRRRLIHLHDSFAPDDVQTRNAFPSVCIVVALGDVVGALVGCEGFAARPMALQSCLPVRAAAWRSSVLSVARRSGVTSERQSG